MEDLFSFNFESINPQMNHGLKIRAGLPTTVTPGSTFSSTQAPAPTVAPAPMARFRPTMAPNPTIAPRPTVTHPPTTAPGAI